MKLRNKNIVKIITLILALLVPQKMLAYGIHASLFHNQSTGHTVALLGDNHAKSNTDRAEPIFETITKPHFEKLLTQDNTYHVIVEGEENQVVALPVREILENQPLINKLNSSCHYPHENIMQMPITTRLTLNDERSYLLGKITVSYLHAQKRAKEFGVSCIERIKNNVPIPPLKPGQKIKFILKNKNIQELLLDNHNLDVQYEMCQAVPTNISETISAHDILNQLEDCEGQARYYFQEDDNPQQKMLWSHYLLEFRRAYNSAKKSFSGLEKTDMAKPGVWTDALVDEIFDRQTLHVPWMDVILNTLAEFGFMVKITEDITLHKKTFLYAGADHCYALQPHLESLGYTHLVEFNCPNRDTQTLSQTEYDQFFTQFFA